MFNVSAAPLTIDASFSLGSKFGATLDMVTDRSSSVLLLAFLMHHPPRLLNDSLISSIYGPSTFALLIALDISSHYMHMTAMLASGSDSHKRIPRKHRNHHKILSLYYENQYVLFFFCLFNELFFVALYVAALPTHAWQAFTNMTAIGETGLRSLLFLSLPFSVIKQVISAVQLQNAADTLVASQDQLTSSKKDN